LFVKNNDGAWSYVFASVLDVHGPQPLDDATGVHNALCFTSTGFAEFEVLRQADVHSLQQIDVLTFYELCKVVTCIDPETRLFDPRSGLHPVAVPDPADACLQGEEFDLGEEFDEDHSAAMTLRDVQSAIASIAYDMMSLAERNAPLEDRRNVHRTMMRRYLPDTTHTSTSLDVVRYLTRRQDESIPIVMVFEATWDPEKRRPVPGGPSCMPIPATPPAVGSAARGEAPLTLPNVALQAPAAVKSAPNSAGRPPPRVPGPPPLPVLTKAPPTGDRMAGEWIQPAPAGSEEACRDQCEMMIIRAPPPPLSPPPPAPGSSARPERRVHPRDLERTP
jgi:hypothetical protein